MADLSGGTGYQLPTLSLGDPLSTPAGNPSYVTVTLTVDPGVPRQLVTLSIAVPGYGVRTVTTPATSAPTAILCEDVPTVVGSYYVRVTATDPYGHTVWASTTITVE